MARRSLVLLHGQPGSGDDWRTVVEELDPGLDVEALDRPGYGENPLPPGDFEAGAHAVVAALDRRGVDSAVLVGHSFGGGVALATAELAPERVAALVLVASVGPACTDGWDRLLAAPVAGEICAVAAWWLTPWFARARMARLARLRDRPLDHDEQVNWQVWGEARHRHGAMWRTFLTEQRAVMRSLDDVLHRLGEIDAPTLILADPLDPLIPFRTAEALQAALPHARLEQVEVGAHHLPRRAPSEVAGAINRFLREVDAPPA